MAILYQIALDKRNVGPTFFVQNTDPVTADAAYVRAGTPWIKTEADSDPWGNIMGYYVRNADDTAWLLVAQGPAGDGSGSGLDADTLDGLSSAAFLQHTLADAKGDILAASAADTIVRLAVGTDGQVLVAASGQATGLQWTTVGTTGIADGAVTYAKLQDASTNNILLGRRTTGAGDYEEITVTGGGLSYNASNFLQIAGNGVTNGKLDDMANFTIKGRHTASSGDPEDLTPAQAREVLGLSVNVATEAGATFTYAIGDAFKYYRFTDGSPQVTVPANGSVAFPIGTELYGVGTTGQVEFIEDSGVTINTPETLLTAKAFAAFALKKVATDEWDLMGYLEEA